MPPLKLFLNKGIFVLSQPVIYLWRCSNSSVTHQSLNKDAAENTIIPDRIRVRADPQHEMILLFFSYEQAPIHGLCQCVCLTIPICAITVEILPRVSSNLALYVHSLLAGTLGERVPFTASEVHSGKGRVSKVPYDNISAWY